jgi:hypothetical protein
MQVFDEEGAGGGFVEGPEDVAFSAFGGGGFGDFLDFDDAAGFEVGEDGSQCVFFQKDCLFKLGGVSGETGGVRTCS